MLLRFYVENFLSFKGKNVFSMVAGKFTRHNDHVATVDGKKILKGGFIFGANAGGKTNFVRAIDFARKIVVEGLASVSCEKKHFRIEDVYKDKPGVFQFDIYSCGSFYSYGFAISYNDVSIKEEWLYKINNGEDKCIFLRQNEGKVALFTSDLNFNNSEDKDRFKVYSEAIKDNKMKQTLFLTDIILHSPENNIQYKAFRDVKKWFDNLTVIFPGSKFQGYPELLKDSNVKKIFENLLKYFDTGILNIGFEEEDFDKVFRDMPHNVIESFKADIINALLKNNDKRDSILLMQNGESLIQIKYFEGKLLAKIIVSNHGNTKDLFRLIDESDGTKRLFDLIPLFLRIRQNGVIIVDELDRSLHTMLTKEFINYFYKQDYESKAQLIATTHDSNILDLDFLRQDEIWFVDREHDHGSKMYSLDRFKARFDKKIEKDYLLGRYGAIPIFYQEGYETNYEDDSIGVHHEK